MKPILFSLGPFHVYAFGLMVAVGALLSFRLMLRRARQEGFPTSDQVSDLVAVTLFGGFLGARLLYVFENAAWYWKHPLKIFLLWEGGLVFYGGVAGSMLALYFYLRSKKMPYWKGLDFLLPYVALTHAFGRLGCFLNGCCYGRVCRLPWAVQFPELPEPVHPVQLYEAFFNFCLFLFLRFHYSRRRFEGEISALYFMGYALGRFLMEFWRGDNPAWFFLTVNQWISAGIFLAAGAWWRIRKS